MGFMAKVLARCICAGGKKKEKRKFLISDILQSPEDFMLTAYIEHDELFIRVKRKEVEASNEDAG